MDDMTVMNKEIRKLTLILALLLGGISIMVFQGAFQSITIGIFIGALSGIIGYNMIVHMSNSIEYYENPKAKGYSSYVKRYAVYTLIFALSVYKGVNIFALLAGMLCHKAAILIYVFLHRKEDD